MNAIPTQNSKRRPCRALKKPKASLLLIFDLDDTLYEEQQFVLSGFRAVARMAAKQWGMSAPATEAELAHLLCTQGRGTLFDKWLQRHQLLNKKRVQECIRCYRSHPPDIQLNAAAKKLLPILPKPLYLVTDGNKHVQANKVKALGIEPYFKKIFITHRWGIQHAKPSPYCFERIRHMEQCSFEKMVYIGDNPHKDFVYLNPLGMITVRLLTGMFKDQKAKPGFDSRYTLKSLAELPALLQQLHTTAP